MAQAANKILGTNEFNGMQYTPIITATALTIPTTDLKLLLGVYFRSTLLPIPGILYTDVSIDAHSNNPPWNMNIWSLMKYPEKFLWLPAYTTLLSKTWDWDISLDDYQLRSLCATGNLADISGRQPYKILISKQEDPIRKYEHLPLIWSIINNNFGYITDNDRNEIKSLLSEAPSCGPHKYIANGTLQYDKFNWSSSSRLVWPENSGENCSNWLGDYNGLDYMLLHNLYWLSNHQYPENLTFAQSLGFPFWLFGYPLQGIARNEVIGNQTVILEKGSVNFLAGNKVTLKTGFSVSAIDGKSFTARVTNGMTAGEGPIFFQQVSIADYPQCSSGLKSVEIDYPTDESIMLLNDSITVYPNPCHNQINIQNITGREISRYEICSVIGTVIKQYENKSRASIVSLDISALEVGLYLIKVYGIQNNANLIKIIKQ
jgi:hypothetical protein